MTATLTPTTGTTTVTMTGTTTDTINADAGHHNAPPSVPASMPLDIDLVDVEAALAALGIVQAELVALVNQGVLAAYRIDGHLRFRRCAVSVLATN